MSVDYSQGTPAPPPQKKGLGPLGWVAIGCGALFLIGLIIVMGIGFMGKRMIDKAGDNPEMAAVKLAIGLSPELEVVESDDEAKTITIRNKTTDEVITVGLEDAKRGRFKFRGKDGEQTVDFDAEQQEGGGLNVTTTDEKGETATVNIGGGTAKLPDWLPVYPGGSATGTFDTTTAQERTAMVTVTTPDSTEKVMEFYEARLKNAGMEVQKSTMSAGNGMTGGTVSGSAADQKRTASVMVTQGDGGTQAIVSFTEKQ